MRQAVLEAGAAGMTPGDFARAMGVDDDRAQDLLADYDVRGYVTARETDDGVLVSLTGAGGRVLGLVREGGEWGPIEDSPRGRAAAARRDWAGELRFDPSGNPYPTSFVGSGMQWDNVPREACPACKGGPLRENMYCLYCDRCGLDDDGGLF